MAKKTKQTEEVENPFDEKPESTQTEEVSGPSNPPSSELDDLFSEHGQLRGTDQRTDRSGDSAQRRRGADDGIVPVPLDLDANISLAPTQKEATPDPIATPNMPEDTVESIQRSEEIAAELVRTNGRYIENIDNAKVGKTIQGALNTDPHAVDKPLTYAYQSDGVNTSQEQNNGILDTGYGAQKADINPSHEPNDPRSPDFMICMNTACAYRDNCLRFRMKNKRHINKGLFFPEQCRKDGTYISLDETDFTGYDNFESLDNPQTPTRLGPPE